MGAAHPTQHLSVLRRIAGNVMASPAVAYAGSGFRQVEAQRARVEGLLPLEELELASMLRAAYPSATSTRQPTWEPARKRRISTRGVHAIAHFEGFVNHPYPDYYGNATIGYGHKLHDGPVTDADRRKWGTITRAEGEKILRGDIAKAAAAVRHLVKVPLKQSQFDALVSFTFVEGAHGLAISDALKDLNARRYNRVSGDFLHFDRHNPGLQNRHRAEAAMFAHGVYP